MLFHHYIDVYVMYSENIETGAINIEWSLDTGNRGWNFTKNYCGYKGNRQRKIKLEEKEFIALGQEI